MVVLGAREIIAIFAHSLAASIELPVAVIFDPGHSTVLGWMPDQRQVPYDTGTGIASCLRALAEGRDLTGLEIFSTDPPTHMDLGMAALCGVIRISCLRQDGRLDHFTPGNGLDPARPAQPSTEADLERLAPGTMAWVKEELGALRDRRLRFLDAVAESCPVPGLGDQMKTLRHMGWAIADYCEPDPPAPLYPVSAPVSPGVDLYWISIAKKLTATIHRAFNSGTGPFRGHNIGCVLVSPDGEVLAWGVNTNASNATRHAETSCIWMYQRRFPGRKIPVGAVLYTTLQSCVMCSGTICHAAGGNQVRVVYLDKDKVEGSALRQHLGPYEQHLVAGGQHLLAAARWARLRRSVLEPKPMPRGDFYASFTENRDQVEATLRTRNDLIAQRTKARAAVEVSSLREQGKFNEIGAANTRVRLLVTAEVNQEMGQFEEMRARLLQIEAFGMSKVGQGAPVLLRQPEVVRRLDELLEQIPREPSTASLEQICRDLGTINHALRLLLQVMGLAASYRDR